MAEADELDQGTDMLGFPTRPGLLDATDDQLFDRSFDHPASNGRAATEPGRVSHAVLMTRKGVRHTRISRLQSRTIAHFAGILVHELAYACPSVCYQRRPGAIGPCLCRLGVRVESRSGQVG